MAFEYSDEKIVSTFKLKACNVSATASALHCTRKTFYDWRKNRPGLRELLEDCEEALIDNAETHLHSNIQNGDTTSLIFFLKTKGKKRGYTERIEYEDVDPVEVMTREEKIARIHELRAKAARLDEIEDKK